MMRRPHFVQKIVLFVLLLLLVGVSAWLQFGLLGKSGAEISSASTGDSPGNSDYYIENFTSTGIDRVGKKYRLSAERLEHYPADDQAQLQRPHIIQYQSDGAPRHIYADSGRLYADAEVLLSGNVKLVENHSGVIDGAVVTSQKMLVRLKGGGD